MLAASKHGDYQAAKSLIRRRAKELGVRLESLPGFGTVAASADTMQLALAMGQYEGGGEAVALAGLTQETSARRSREAGQDSADAVIARHPELAHLFKAGRTSDRKHPARSGKLIGTKTRAHGSDTGNEDPQDTDQPSRGGQVHRGVRAIIEANPDLFTDGEGHEGGSGNRSDGPKSAAQREREEKRSQAGRPAGRGIGDLSRGSARTRSGR